MKASSEKKYRSNIISALGIGLFAVSGLISSYLYHALEDGNGNWPPGVIFISVTVLYFILIKSGANILQLVVYYVLMVATYQILFWMTYFTSSLAVVAGCVAAGLGAVATVGLINSCIIPMDFSRPLAFGVGALSWAITDFTEMQLDQSLSDTLFGVRESQMSAPFGDIFIIWQFLVGAFLVFQIRKVSH